MRVLVLESTPEMGEETARLVKEAGHTVIRSVNTVDAALGSLIARPDLVLADVSLAAADHGRLIQELARSAKPISSLLILPKHSPRLLEAVQKLGVMGQVVRPFTAQDLETALAPLQRPAASGQRTSEALQLERSVQKQQTIDTKARNFFLRGFGNLKLRKFDAAVLDFAKALKCQSLFPEAYKGLAEAFRGQGDLEKSGQFLTQAAIAYVLTDREEDAEKLYETLRKADPEAPNPFHVAAERLKDQGKQEKALQCHEKAAALSPHDASVQSGLGQAYMDAGRKDEALATIAPLLEKGKGSEAASQLFLSITGEEFSQRQSKKTKQSKVTILDDKDDKDEKDFNEKRRAPRIPLADHFIKLAGHEEPFPVVDISRTGIGFKSLEKPFKPGQAIQGDLVTLEKTQIKKLTLTVAHATKGLVGCRFSNMTEKQKKQLNYLLLNEKPAGEFVVDKEVNFDIGMW